MEYLSVCSGIEAATVGWHPLGWEPVGFSEIEKFPSAVLAHHYPDVQNYGDMNDYRKWPRSDIDVLVGGTPCQSFSVAGLRAGMADPRGNLALVYLAIAEYYRPDWLVWENVPGCLSSDEGRDFGAIVGAMVKLGYGIAYRVLDAQYFGVPQRRRRVFVVGYLGDWRRAAEVLFEPESLRRNPPPSRETGEKIAASLTAGSGVNSNDLGRRREDDINLTVSSPLLGKANDSHDESKQTYVTHSLSGEGFDASEDGTGRGTPIVAFAQNQRDEVRMMDKAGALAVEPGAKQQTYVFKQGQGSKAGSIGGDENVAPTLGAAESGTNRTPALMHGAVVRHLTPLECERLQGFPDGYTHIPGASDSGRYKALGNSMAVPVMRWIGERIESQKVR